MKKVDPVTGKPSSAAGAISLSSYRGRRKVYPVTGKPSSADDAISHNAYKKRVRRKRKRNNKHTGRCVKRSKVSLEVYKEISDEVMDPGNSIKTEVNDYKLGF